MPKPIDHADLRAEREVIASSLLDAECLAVARDTLRPEHFSKHQHEVIWRALLSIQTDEPYVGTAALLSALERRGELVQAGGDEYVISVSEGGIPIPGRVERQANDLRTLFAVRETRAAALRIAAEASEPLENPSEFLDRAETALTRSAAARALASEPVHVAAAVVEVFEDITHRANTGTPVGYATGLRALDNQIGGMVPGELIVVAGKSGSGKSAFAQRCMDGIADAGGLVFCSSLEMKRDNWARRLLSSRARVDGKRLRNGRISREEWDTLTQEADRISQRPIYIWDEPSPTILDIRRAARRTKQLAKLATGIDQTLKLVVIDYAQLVRPYERAESREQEVAAVARGAAALAKELYAPVMLLAQLNRDPDKRQDKRPTVADLRESAALEHAADTILLVYRDEQHNADSKDPGVAEIIIGKARSGPCGTVRVAFIKETTSFENLETRDYTSERYA